MTTTTGTITTNPGMNSANIQANSNTTYSGARPIIFGSRDQNLIVKMFKDGDPAGVDGISARDTLGPDWETLVASNDHTCL